MGLKLGLECVQKCYVVSFFDYHSQVVKKVLTGAKIKQNLEKKELMALSVVNIRVYSENSRDKQKPFERILDDLTSICEKG